MSNDNLNTWPEKIHLQHFEDDEIQHYQDAQDVSWCTDKIYGSDVAYVRADLARSDAVDAERYRYLRRRAFMLDHSEPHSFTVSFFDSEGPSGEFFDKNIDAAIAARTKDQP